MVELIGVAVADESQFARLATLFGHLGHMRWQEGIYPHLKRIRDEE